MVHHTIECPSLGLALIRIMVGSYNGYPRTGFYLYSLSSQVKSSQVKYLTVKGPFREPCGELTESNTSLFLVN